MRGNKKKTNLRGVFKRGGDSWGGEGLGGEGKPTEEEGKATQPIPGEKKKIGEREKHYQYARFFRCWIGKGGAERKGKVA